MKSITLIFAVLLVGCGTKVIRPDVVLPTRQQPDEAMVECPAIAPLKSGDFEAVVMKLESVSTEYNLCRSKQRQLSDYIKSVK